MTHTEAGAPRSAVHGWRAVLEIALFATAAAVLVTGPNIANVGRALAWFPGAPVFQAQPQAPAKPARAPRNAGVRKAPSAAPVSKASPSVLIPAGSRPAAAVPPRSGRSDSSKPNAVSTPQASAAAADSTPAPTAETRLPHFHSLMDTGIALYNDGWYGPALARFRRAAAVLPDSPYAHLWWGRAAVAAGRPDEARVPLARAIALAPGTEVARKASLLLGSLD